MNCFLNPNNLSTGRNADAASKSTNPAWTSVVADDENGLRIAIERRSDDDDTMRDPKLMDAWKSFQRTRARLPPNVARLAVSSTEEIPAGRPPVHGDGAAKPPTASGDPAPPTVCTTCGKTGDHDSPNCPYEDLITSPRAAVGRTAAQVCPACRRPAERSDAERTIRVANLPAETSERDLYDLFCHFGVLNGLGLARAPDDDGEPQQQPAAGIPRGKVGVVEFDIAEDAEQAIEWIDGHVYGGRALRVEWTAPYVPPTICARCVRDSETCVRVCNLPEDTSERDLHNLVGCFGVVSRLHIGSDENTSGCRRRKGVVEFVQREDAEQAIKWLHGYVYGDLVIWVEGPFRASPAKTLV